MRNIFKRILSVSLVGMLLMSTPVFGFAEAEKPAEAFPPLPIETTAKAVVLADVDSGQVLAAKAAHEKLYPASVTKIMTLLLVVEALDAGKIALTDTVTTSREAAGKGGSQIWLKEGETMTVDELLKATAVASANDASEALAEYVAGSATAFVAKMNERAKELGMHDTHFENCTGLDDDAENHQTSAYDVMLMSRALLKHETILNYSTIWMDSLRGGKTELVNTNKLVRFYDGATGLKTGTTSKAGCCVSASAKRENTHLVAVVMGSENSKERFKTARELLDWGFANYETAEIEIDAAKLAPIEVLRGEKTEIMPQMPKTEKFLIKKGMKEKITEEIKLPLNVEAPVEKGQLLGEVILHLDDEILFSYKLLSGEEVKALSFAEAFRRILCVLCG